jgi:basic membrane lipoprotein Med (substrate-binding protein (PBP1-ABC) superfamily)/DNA-binding SARP family transcriptional activator
MGGTGLEFRILGPLEVLRDGERLDLGPPKQRALLVLLLLHANRVVPTDRILEDLWGENAVGKENSLWVYVSQLRTVIEPGRDGAEHPEVLVTRDHGYVLNVDPGSIDAVRFEREVGRGRSLLTDDVNSASQVLHESLGLWRGAALQDFAYDDFVQTEITRLEELRIGAMEDAADADLRRGRAGEIVADLEVLHREHPLRERPVGQLMLALYRAGRSADALRTFERFRRGLGEELGIDPSPELSRLEEQILLHDSRLQLRIPGRVQTRTQRDAVNPFKGLRSFREDDAQDFFGRDSLVSDVVRRSGKSSVVHAGLIPALRKDAVPGSDQWLIAHMLPGSDPFIELEAALLRTRLDAPHDLSESFQHGDNSGLLRAALRLLPDESSRLVLVIDQFEELFTLVSDELVRGRFLDQLVAAVDDAYNRVIVVVTLRSDLYSHPLEYAEFANRMGTGVVNVVPLTSDELETAALHPAEQSGVTLEPALLAELLTDVIGQPGGLPMFQYTLTELFDRRVGDVLSVEAYRAMGGVRGALTRRAEDLYGQLDDGEREAGQQLFLRLVGISEQGEWSRRRVHASEIVALDVDVVAMQRVIESLVGHRLLTLDRDQASGAPTVEVAHESLLHEWERLREWIEENRGDLQKHREFAMAASRWHAADRDHDYLYTGGRLDESVQWQETSTMKLTKREHDFLEAALARRTLERDAEQERVGREHQLERRARRRTGGMAAAVVTLAAVLIGVLWVSTRSPGPRIALVYEGVVGGGAAQQLILDGWEDAVRRFDFEAEAPLIPLIDDAEQMSDLAEAGVDLIVVGLFDGGEAVFEIAGDHPDTHFVVFTGETPPFDNVTALHFEREEVSFLVGAAAALQSETGKVGFIGGWQQPSTEARRAAFTAGAQYVDRDTVVNSVYLGPFHNPSGGPYLDIDLAKATAAAMYLSGVDVIHHSAGTAAEGIPAAATELTADLGRDLWVIGSEVNERLFAPSDHQDRFLTSMYKRSDKAIVEALRAYIAGELSPGLRKLGMASGSVDYSRDGGISDTLIAALDRIRADIVAGTVVPPSAVATAPGWTREPDVVGTLTFDGETCALNIPTTEVVAGDVVLINIVNDSIFDLGTSFANVVETATFTSPGTRNSMASRLAQGPYSVSCLTADGNSRVATITAHFEVSCDGPIVGSSDPESVIRAVADAITARDADAVCSLFAETAAVIDSFEGDIDGNMSIAEILTPFDDDRWFQEYAITKVAVSGNTVIFSTEWRGLDEAFASVDHRAIVENGKITRWEWGN